MWCMLWLKVWWLKDAKKIGQNLNPYVVYLSVFVLSDTHTHLVV